MRVLPAIFLIAVVLVAAATKTLATIAYPPLYHALQFFPAKLAGILSGESYSEQQGIYRFTTFVLDYSCAGVNFLLLCLAAGAWLLRNRVKTCMQLTAMTAFLVPAALFATNVANAFRIGLSLRLMHISERHAWLHEAIGTIVFILFLLVYYQILLRFSNDKTRPTT